MSNAKSLMWAHQSYFKIGLKNVAESALRYLDQRFRPDVFLVGVRVTDELTPDIAACVEPEEEFWAESSDFISVLDHAAAIEKEVMDRELLQPHTILKQVNAEWLKKKYLQAAIEKSIEESKNRPENITYWVSLPVKVGLFWVSAVIGLQNEILNQYERLGMPNDPISTYRNVPVAGSLIESTVSELLSIAEGQLATGIPGSGLLDSDPDDIIRSAGSRLMAAIGMRVDSDLAGKSANLFRSFNTISSLKHEGSAGHGTILVAKKQSAGVQVVAEFETPTKLANFRGSRKLLNLSSDSLLLHTDGTDVIGLAMPVLNDTHSNEVFVVKIIGQSHWELAHFGQVLMRVTCGNPALPRKLFNEQKLKNDIPRIFKDIDSKSVSILVDLVKQAGKESHGTILIITENAAAEARRLENQATPLIPCPLTPTLLKHLTPIDGALIISPQSVCHSIGTILDGRATHKGDSSRGARYNSAVRYLEECKCACMAVIVSEDGEISLLPDLRPAIKKSEIQGAIKALEKISGSVLITDVKKYVKLYDWLVEHAFYLKEDQAAAINGLIETIELKLDKQAPGRIRMIRDPFTRNSDFVEHLHYRPD